MSEPNLYADLLATISKEAANLSHDYSYLEDRSSAINNVLERRLLPLLLAGQDMRDKVGGGQFSVIGANWDAALEAAAKESQ